MTWKFQGDRPIYTQLLEQIQLLIISGVYPAGSKLPSVRDMASDASVNPNTMQKALSELERLGFLYSQRTSGRFVTEDSAMITQVKKELANKKIQEFFKTMRELGYEPEDAVIFIENAVKEIIL